MYGLIGKMKAVPGQRKSLIAILLESAGNLPGCLSYVVAKDPADADAIWVTEIWDSQESHRNSLSLPAVQQVIARGRPLIAGFGERFETEPVGGHGLATRLTHLQRDPTAAQACADHFGAVGDVQFCVDR